MLKQRKQMSKGTAEQYLEMYLSEQIPETEWHRILKERTDVKELYHKYKQNRKNGLYNYWRKCLSFSSS